MKPPALAAVFIGSGLSPCAKDQPQRTREIAVPVLDEVYDVLGLVR